jgi:hypothetical protein
MMTVIPTFSFFSFFLSFFSSCTHCCETRHSSSRPMLFVIRYLSGLLSGRDNIQQEISSALEGVLGRRNPLSAFSSCYYFVLFHQSLGGCHLGSKSSVLIQPSFRSLPGAVPTGKTGRVRRLDLMSAACIFIVLYSLNTIHDEQLVEELDVASL